MSGYRRASLRLPPSLAVGHVQGYHQDDFSLVPSYGSMLQGVSLICSGKIKCFSKDYSSYKQRLCKQRLQPQKEPGVKPDAEPDPRGAQGQVRMPEDRCQHGGWCRSPLTAVRLENLRLDHLVAGAAHHEVEVVMCGIMAK